MKKIIFTLLALVGTMSMNAQVMKVMKNGEVVKTYFTIQADEVVFKEVPFGQGCAEATDIGYVTWIQLWENGPKFAEFNIGATSATDYGGYYCWGSRIGKDSNGAYKSGTGALTGTDDTATNLWGSNWRMPTKEEFNDLRFNCTVEWKDDYNGTAGFLCTGKEDYKDNSVFLPAAGLCYYGDVYSQGEYGYYWSSTPYVNDEAYVNDEEAYSLYFHSHGETVGTDLRYRGFSVRAVLAE